jgi:hypothetical protein
MNMESHGGMTLAGGTEELGDNPVPVPSPTTNPTWTNPGFCLVDLIVSIDEV